MNPTPSKVLKSSNKVGDAKKEGVVGTASLI